MQECTYQAKCGHTLIGTMEKPPKNHNFIMETDLPITGQTSPIAPREECKGCLAQVEPDVIYGEKNGEFYAIKAKHCKMKLIS